MSKTCRGCGEAKPLSEFYAYKRKDRDKTYYMSYCKPCDNRRTNTPHNPTIKVVSCPDNAYPRGSIFLETDFRIHKGKKWAYKSTLMMGCWVPGMVIEKEDGSQWQVVCEDPGEYHRLEMLGFPLDEPMPPQRLEQI